MFKHEQKTTRKTRAKVTPKAEEITCYKCQYIRKKSDLAPVWQCPSCLSAYSKISQETVEIRDKKAISEFRQSLAETGVRKKVLGNAMGFALFGAYLMYASFTNCGCSPDSFGLLTGLLGAGILAGSIKYYFARK